MPVPRLSFFCELETPALERLFAEINLQDLVDLKAGVSLGILDLSPERAEVVRRLNTAGVSVTAWLLLPREQGYWLNLGNGEAALNRYEAMQVWARQNGLTFDGVGLDFEPDLADLERCARERWRILPVLLRRSLDRRRLWRGQADYKELARRIRMDGLRLDTYMFSLIADERLAHSSLLRRSTGIVDLPADREIWMLYSSMFRGLVGSQRTPLGVALLASYAPEAQAVALGLTASGVETGLTDPRPLSWDEFARDLRLAYYSCQDLHIFNLEGCVHNGWLAPLKSFTWDQPILLPEEGIALVDAWRASLGSLLWFSAHILPIAAGLAAGLGAIWGVRKLSNRKKASAASG